MLRKLIGNKVEKYILPDGELDYEGRFLYHELVAKANRLLT